MFPTNKKAGMKKAVFPTNKKAGMKKVGYYILVSPYFFGKFVKMIKENYKLATVNSKYCDYLRRFDYRVVTMQIKRNFVHL